MRHLTLSISTARRLRAAQSKHKTPMNTAINGSIERAARPVAPGVRVTGSQGAAIPFASYISTRAERPGNRDQMPGGKGTSCSKTRPTAQASSNNGNCRCARVAGGRPATKTSNGKLRSWGTASDTRPCPEAPPKTSDAARTAPLRISIACFKA